MISRHTFSGSGHLPCKRDEHGQQLKIQNGARDKETLLASGEDAKNWRAGANALRRSRFSWESETETTKDMSAEWQQLPSRLI
jgi:hypothetical protein